MERVDIRLQIIKTLVPIASRVGLVNNQIIDVANEIEMYVVNGKKVEPEKMPDPIVTEQVKKPKKPVAKEEKPAHTSGRKKHK